MSVEALEPDSAGACGRERHYACLVVAAMGDAKVPDLAQLVHLWVLRRRGLLNESRWMRYGHPPPVDHVWAGVYIEDRAVMGILRGRHAEEDRATVRDLVPAAEGACRDAGLVRHSAKEVRDTEATIWGCAVSGRQRVVRSDPPKLVQVVGVTLLVLARGLWVHHLLCHRA